MLIAEINGKVCPDVEGIEDLLTSAVFGHLRMVRPPLFWADLLRRARTVAPDSKSLLTVLRSQGIEIERYDQIHMQFWRMFADYGEPDLLVQFASPDSPTFLLLIEIKLNSGKSGLGERDQLAKYLRLLRDDASLADSSVPIESRFLVYLTRSFAADEIRESMTASGLRSASMFGLEWNDILDAAYQSRLHDPLLAEVAEFLARRGLQRFSGMKPVHLDITTNGQFYRNRYLDPGDVYDMSDVEGSFYG